MLPRPLSPEPTPDAHPRRGVPAPRFALLVGLAAALALLAATPLVARAAKGGGAKYLAAFDDDPANAIRSDGAGPYDASFSGRDQELTISTGARALFLDFSVLVSGPGDTPFGTATSGWLTGVTYKGGVQGDPGTEGGIGSSHLEFNAPAPDGSGLTQWWLYMRGTVKRVDVDGDGATDVYELAGTADTLLWWDGSQQQGPGHRGGKDPAGGWTQAGTYSLPWAIMVAPK